MMNAVVVGLPSAVQDRLPVDVPDARPGRPGVLRRPGEGRGDLGPSARGRGAAAAGRPPETDWADRAVLVNPRHRDRLPAHNRPRDSGWRSGDGQRLR
jgi:hypothetical protein